MEKTTFTIGEPVFHGEEATVPVTRSATPFTEAKSLPLTQTNFGGVWKIHPLMENPLEMVRDPDEDIRRQALCCSLYSPAQNNRGSDIL